MISLFECPIPITTSGQSNLSLQYANDKFDWPDVVIGIGHSHGFWAWVLARLTNRKCIYYCIDFYSPKIAKNKWDKIFIWCAMQMDEFLIDHVDRVWDISDRINKGRMEFMNYTVSTKIVPLSYPPDYFRFKEHTKYKRIAYVGLAPYGLELLNDFPIYWLGQNKRLPLEELLENLSICGIGFSCWKDNGNNYYGDPGKTKLYSACGLPVIMTDNSPYADIIRKTNAGVVVPYTEATVKTAINLILQDYDYYKNNVKKTWEYINADEVFRNIKLLD